MQNVDSVYIKSRVSPTQKQKRLASMKPKMRNYPEEAEAWSKKLTSYIIKILHKDTIKHIGVFRTQYPLITL
jgi:hypothetical protein